MSTSKHIGIICIAATIISVLAVIFCYNAASLGLIQTDSTIGYEEKLFDTEYVHTVDLVVDDWDSFIETCENEEYTNCTVVIDGEKYSNIGLRAKGNTSLSNVSSMDSQRYSFKLEFDQYQEGLSYYGLDKLCLNNLIQDNTMMKDYITYRLMEEFGVDAPLCSYVYITVNGEDWGLYLAVESIEDSFLERNYGSDYGELYKPDSLSMGGGRGNGMDFDIEDLDLSSLGIDTSNFDPDSIDTSKFDAGNFDSSDFDFSSIAEGGVDFSNIAEGNPGSGGGFSFDGMGSDDVKLKYSDDDADSYSNIFDNAKTNVSTADKTRLINALKNLTEYSDLENTLDMDEVLRYFVVHNFVCNGDSYTGSMIHNYYLYEEDGQLSMIPWDYNLAYGTFMGGIGTDTVNTSIDDPVSNGDVDDRPMVGWIFSSEEYTEMYHELFAEFIDEWYTSGKLEQMIADTAEMIRPYVEKDPTKFCTTEEFEKGVIALSDFCTLRAEAVSRQLAGDTTLVDASDLNLSDMGTMGSTGGGGFGGGEKPDGFSFGSGEMPEGFSFDSGEMPEGFSFGSGERPEGFNSDSSERPEGFSFGSGEIPNESGSNESTNETSGDSGNNTKPGNMPGGFGGNERPGNMPGGFGGGFGGGSSDNNTESNFPTTMSSGSFSPAGIFSNLSSILWIAASLAVLGIGLVVAIKIKH